MKNKIYKQYETKVKDDDLAMNKPMRFLVSSETIEKLDKVCDVENLTRSEIMRALLTKFLNEGVDISSVVNDENVRVYARKK